MTSHTLTHPVVSAEARHSLPSSSLGRLVKVEARKLVDTRAGFWLNISGILLTMATIATVAVLSQLPEVRGPETKLSWFTVSSTGSMMAMFLGILAVMTMTGEWTTRTALTTFCLEPRRGRVAAAKMVVLFLATLGMVALSLLVGAAVIVILQATGGNVSWAMTPVDLAAFTASTLFNTFMGAGFGLLLANTPAAIVAYFALPIAAALFSTMREMVPWMGKTAPWIDPQPALSALHSGTMSGTQWAQLAVVVLLWIGIPTAIGLVLWQRRQVS